MGKITYTLKLAAVGGGLICSFYLGKLSGLNQFKGGYRLEENNKQVYLNRGDKEKVNLGNIINNYDKCKEIKERRNLYLNKFLQSEKQLRSQEKGIQFEEIKEEPSTLEKITDPVMKYLK